MSPLQEYLTVSALLFSIGFAGVVARRNAIVVLMGIELMLNAGNLNLLAFWKYGSAGNPTGYIFILFSIGIAAAESAVGLALVILIYRHYRTTDLNRINELHG